MAREERARHLQMYPGWSARDNYAVHKKRKKRKNKPMKEEDEEEQQGCGMYPRAPIYYHHRVVLKVVLQEL